MSGEHYFNEIMGGGAALFDFDNDGDLDLYLLQGRELGPDLTFAPPAGMPLTDRLYRNDLQPGGGATLRFTDVTEASGIEAAGYGMGVATGDFDNDGWTDLYVTNFGSNQLLRNRGDGTFDDVTAASGADDPRWSVAATFFDFDRDGWLDLYVGNYVDYSLEGHTPCPLPSGVLTYCAPGAYPPATDSLFRNRGDGTFEDVSASSGIGAEAGSGLGAVAADFNGDRWIDLYVANDLMWNRLWINRGDGSFADNALLAGVAVNREGQPEAGMGVDAGDFDGDGDPDIVVSHLEQETNTLYVNGGAGLFRDQSASSQLGPPSLPFTAFGIGWIDYDNDSWLDVLVVNGAVIGMDALIRAGDPYPLRQTDQLFRNLGDGSFAEVTADGRRGLRVVRSQPRGRLRRHRQRRRPRCRRRQQQRTDPPAAQPGWSRPLLAGPATRGPQPRRAGRPGPGPPARCAADLAPRPHRRQLRLRPGPPGTGRPRERRRSSSHRRSRSGGRTAPSSAGRTCRRASTGRSSRETGEAIASSEPVAPLG